MRIWQKGDRPRLWFRGMTLAAKGPTEAGRLVVMRIQSNGRFGLVPSLSSIHETLMGLILAWGEENGFEGRSGRNVRAGQASETCIQDRAQSAPSSSADMGLTCCDSVGRVLCRWRRRFNSG